MIFGFGECTLDLQQHTLQRTGQYIRLRPKVFQALLYLLEHRDRTVPKQEMCEQVWSQQVISDATLESTIRAVRQAIGDSGRAQRLIQTVYGYGYRFIAAVEEYPDAPADMGDAAIGVWRAPGTGLRQEVQHLTSAPLQQEAPGGDTAHQARDVTAEAGAPRRDGSVPIGEWKFVSVLCCALAEPPMGVPLEVEPRYSALHALSTLAREAVQRYGGTLQPVVGEQLIALFGAPLAQEDHARCAVLAALDLQQHLRQHPPRHPSALGAGLAVRMGIHSGLVVVGDLGLATHEQVTVVGAPTQGALRLQQQATPGTLLVSAVTYHLVQEEVHGTPCGSLTLDGWQAPLPVYAVQGLMQRRAGVPQRTPRYRSPFVGRERERALLHDRLEAVRTGEGQVVSLVGPPGMGKTRLLTEFGHGLSSDQVTWCLGQCLAYGQMMPYLPVRDIVQHICTLAEGEPLEKRTVAVRRRLAALGGVAEEDSALVLQLLGLPVAPELLGQRRPETRQARTFALLGHLIRHAAQHQPLVLAVENVHWIDPTSEAWLAFLVERLAGMAVLLLLTHRPGYQPPWGTHTAVTQLALPPLRAEDSRAIVAAVPGMAQLPAARCQEIVAHGDGNPFFVEELAWYAVEHGRSATPVPVPETVHAVLAARIDRLPAEAKHLLYTAAVVGTEVPLSLLAAVAKLSGDVLHRSLAALQTAEFLYETQRFPEQVYLFKHALTHDAAYNSLLTQRRQELHRLIAMAIEDLYAERLPEFYEMLAYHYERGEVWEKALEYLVQAGQKAQQASANQEAREHYCRALDICERLGEAVGPATRMTIYAGKGAAHVLLSEFHASIEAHQHLREVAQQLGDRHKEAEALSQIGYSFLYAHELEQALEFSHQARALAAEIGNQRLLASSLFVIAWIRAVTGKLDAAIQGLEAALRISREAGEQGSAGFSLNMLGALHTWKGEYEQALRFLEQSCTIGQAPDLRLIGVWGLYVRGMARSGQGEYTAALAALQEALALSDRVGDKIFKCRILNTLGWVHGELYNLEAAIRYNQEGTEAAYRLGDPEIIRNAEINLGDDYLLLGDLAQAQQYLEKVFHAAQQRGKWGEEWMKWRYSQHLYHSLGELWLTKGDAAQALACAEACLKLAEPTLSRKNLVKGWRLKGQALLAQGQGEQAEVALSRALTIGQGVGNPPQLWKTYQALGALYEWQAHVGRARAAYRSALEVIEGVAARLQDQELKGTFLTARPVQEIRARLAQVGSGRP